MEKKGTKGKERKIKVDKYMQNEYKRSKTEKGVIKGMNERERKNAQRRKNDKIKKRIENKYKKREKKEPKKGEKEKKKRKKEKVKEEREKERDKGKKEERRTVSSRERKNKCINMGSRRNTLILH